MIILPAVDIIDGNVVRLLKGDYGKKTVYGTDPKKIAIDFKAAGAEYIHIVDLDGAKTGQTRNFEVIRDMITAAGLFAEVGGGVRDISTVRKYIDAGAARVILGTAAAKDPDFLKLAVKEYGDKIAVGADIKNGFAAVNGWTERTGLTASEFIKKTEAAGVKTIICTDVSKDGVMCGANVNLYKALRKQTGMNIIASGGVSSTEDILALKATGVYGAIIGKAYYTGAINLAEAIEVAK